MNSTIQTGHTHDRSRPLSLIVADQLRHLIYTDQLKPGERLMSEMQLAEHFRCSRSSIREAIHALRMRGLLEVKRGKGTYVAVPSVSDIKNDFLVMARHVGFRNGELAALHSWIAGTMVAAACHGAPEERGSLSRHLVSGDKSAAENAETEIHWYLALGAVARKPFSSMVLEIVLAVTQDERAAQYENPQEVERSKRAYSEINDALLLGDPALARQAMTTFLDSLIMQPGRA